MTISAKMLAGVQIDNANFIGGDLHATIVDLYYPDWNGNLVHIGVLRETSSADNNSIGGGAGGDGNNHGSGTTYNDKYKDGNEKKSCVTRVNRGGGYVEKDRIQANSGGRKEDDHGICLPEKNSATSASSSSSSSPKIVTPSSSPFFTIQPRGISTSKSDAVTITIDDLRPRVYLNLLKDAIVKRGSLEMSISGVAHVKSPLGIPISLGILCDNTVNLLQYPIQILGKNCVVRSISTGWAGLAELAAEVREGAMKFFTERDGEDPSVDIGVEADKSKIDDLESFFRSSEVILDWHDF